jgi:integrase
MGAAVDAGMIPQTPCRRVPLPKVEREEMRFLTPAEVATLADPIDPRYRALVLVGAYGGLRIGELAGLRRSRVDLLRGTVTVGEIVVEVRGVLHIGPPKTRASLRAVGLPRFVVEELAVHLAGLDDPEAFVFTAPEGGWLRVNAFRARTWCQAVLGAGLDGLRIHDLRHSAVALWIAAGANPKEVSVRAGHASVSSPWTATATCTRRPTRRSATAWTTCMAPPSRSPRGRWSGCLGGRAVAPAWPQAAPGTTRAPPMGLRRRSDLLCCLVGATGFEPVTSSVSGRSG